MKYNISINQYAVIKSGLDLDIIDLSIFDFIKDFANSQGCVKIQTPEGIYFWISHKLIIEALPLLKIKTAQGVIKRIENLINSGVLVKHDNCQIYSKTLYCFGKNYDLLTFADSEILGSKQKFDPLNKSLKPPYTKVDSPLNESLDYNNIIYNNNIDNSSGVPHENASLFPEIEKQEKENREKEKEEKARKTLFKNSEVFKLVNNNDYSGFEKKFPGPEYEKIDLVYYFHSVNDWSDKSDTKRSAAGWLATVRTFIRSDMDKNKLKLKIEYQDPGKKINISDAMDFLNDME